MYHPRLDNIGSLEGPILAFGGVYSNLQALEALIDVARSLAIPPSNIICTGDIVAYCAQPEACVQAIKKWGIHCIAGNVEIQISTGQEDCACDFELGSRCANFSKQWYPYAQSQLSPTAIEWMGLLPEFIAFEYAGKKGFVVHGSFHHTSEFIFASTPWSTKLSSFTATDTDLMVAGHCGLPFSQSNDGKHWLNPGVIGMPANDGTPRVWYMLLDDNGGELQVEHHSLVYDFEQANRIMQERDLTPEYAETLRTGLWDNCEILPDLETEARGRALDFKNDL